ncbi:hypothetical protein D3C81_1145940 [compost metagenome]
MALLQFAFVVFRPFQLLEHGQEGFRAGFGMVVKVHGDDPFADRQAAGPGARFPRLRQGERRQQGFQTTRQSGRARLIDTKQLAHQLVGDADFKLAIEYKNAELHPLTQRTQYGLGRHGSKRGIERLGHGYGHGAGRGRHYSRMRSAPAAPCPGLTQATASGRRVCIVCAWPLAS